MGKVSLISRNEKDEDEKKEIRRAKIMTLFVIKKKTKSHAPIRLIIVVYCHMVIKDEVVKQT